MNNSFNYFDQIYCINLEKRKDRWDNCVFQFLDYGINNKIKKMKGIIYNNLKLSQKQKAQIGCTLSHYYILQEAQINNLSKILVLEDDFLFLKNNQYTNFILNNCLADLPQDWDLFYLGAFFVKGYDYEPTENYSKNLIKVNTGFCTHAISYSNLAIKKILDQLKLDTEEQILNFAQNYEVIDWYLVKEFQKENKCFAAKDLICIQQEGFSDIENKHFDYKNKFLESYGIYSKNNFSFNIS